MGNNCQISCFKAKTESITLILKIFIISFIGNYMSSWTCQKCGRRFENIISGDIPEIKECPYCGSSNITPF